MSGPQIYYPPGGGGTGGGSADGVNIISAGTQNADTNATVKFADSNGVTFGMSNNSVITATVRTDYQSSGNYLTTAMASNAATISNINLSAGTTSQNLSKVTFNDSNGVSFGLNGSVITATVKTDYQSSNNNYLTSQSAQALSAGNGSFAYQTASFSNANGISFSTSAGSAIVASHNGLTTARASNDAVGLNTAQTNVTWTVNSSGISLNAGAYLTTAAQSSASNISGVIVATASNAATNQTAQLSGAVSFSNTNGVSFYTTASGAVSGIGATVKTDYQSSNANYLTSQLNQAFSAQGGSSAFQTLSFTNSNGFSFSNTNGSIWGSYTVPTVTNSSWTVSDAATSATVGRLAFTNSNGLTLSLSTSNNGNHTVIGSYTVPAVTDYFSKTNTTFNGTNVSGSLTLNTNGLRVDLSAGAGGGVTPVVSNSAGSFSFTTLNFSNANNVTWGTSAGSIVTASVAAPGAAAENNWFNLLGANTAGNTTASGSTIGLSGVNLTLSGTNASAINISAPATSSLSATGGVSLSTNGSTISIGAVAPVTYSRYNEFKESPRVAGEIGQASLHLQPWLIPNLQFDRVVLHKAFSNATNSSNSFTVSDWVGLYTKNGSTLSLLQSTSISTNFSGSGTAGSYLSYGGGIKAQTIGWTTTLTEGHYWIGVVQRTTTGGGAGHTLQQVLNSQMNSSYRGIMGAATNATNQMSTGFGVYSVTTSGMPNSIAITELNGNSSIVLRPPSLYFVSGTV